MRIGSPGALPMLMYEEPPLDHNPVLDDHLLGAIGVIVLGLTLAGDTWGVGKQWARTHLVRQYRFLR
jgi:thiosulfate dehydrogenase [quinone] large subunit